MQVSLKNHSKVSLEGHPNYRVVKVSDRQGSVPMLLPHANLVVPDKQAIRDLKDIILFYEKLKPPESFNYVSGSGYRKYPEPPQLKEKPIEFDRIDNLPLFERQEH
jgi:hypothetical protein